MNITINPAELATEFTRFAKILKTKYFVLKLNAEDGQLKVGIYNTKTKIEHKIIIPADIIEEGEVAIGLPFHFFTILKTIKTKSSAGISVADNLLVVQSEGFSCSVPVMKLWGNK